MRAPRRHGYLEPNSRSVVGEEKGRCLAGIELSRLGNDNFKEQVALDRTTRINMQRQRKCVAATMADLLAADEDDDETVDSNRSPRPHRKNP